MQGTTFGPALFAIGDGTAQRGCLRISDGRVVEVDAGMRRADRELPPGSVVTPGLIDLHVNGTGRSWFNTEPLETLRAMSAQAPRFGVTSFLPSVMTGPWDHMLRAAGIISKEARTPMSGARSLGLHLEGLADVPVDVGHRVEDVPDRAGRGASLVGCRAGATGGGRAGA